MLQPWHPLLIVYPDPPGLNIRSMLPIKWSRSLAWRRFVFRSLIPTSTRTPAPNGEALCICISTCFESWAKVKRDSSKIIYEEAIAMEHRDNGDTYKSVDVPVKPEARRFFVFFFFYPLPTYLSIPVGLELASVHFYRISSWTNIITRNHEIFAIFCPRPQLRLNATRALSSLQNSV